MAWTSGFFNSVNNDRLYNADQMSAIFEGLITYGVYEAVGNKLAVQPNNDMTIQINTGRGFFGKWCYNDSEYLLTLEDADVTLNRYCAVCVRVDLTTEGRTAEPYLKYGDFATNPAKPTMERSETIKEYCLAYVYIAAGATAITAADIEDTRSNANLCGWVTGLIEQIDATTLFEQFEAIFVNWLNSLGNYLDENVEAKLAADMLELKNNAHTKARGTFDGLGWISHDDGTYTQTITVEGVTADNIIFVTPEDAYKDAYVRASIEATAQGENSITFTALDPEDIDIKVTVLIFP